MKILFTLLLLICCILINAQSSPNIPTGNDQPFYTEGEVEMRAKGYHDAPPSQPNIPSYKPSYENRTTEYVNQLRREVLSPPATKGDNKKDVLTTIIDDANSKIDISPQIIPASKIDSVKKVNEEIQEQAKSNAENTQNYSTNSSVKDILIMLLTLALVIMGFVLYQKSSTNKKF